MNIKYLEKLIDCYHKSDFQSRFYHAIATYDYSDVQDDLAQYLKAHILLSHLYGNLPASQTAKDYTVSLQLDSGHVSYLEEVNRDEIGDIEECFFGGTADTALFLSLPDAIDAFIQVMKLTAIQEPRKSVQINLITEDSEINMFQFINQD